MFDVVKIIRAHTDLLKNGVGKFSVDQRKNWASALSVLFFKLPSAEETLTSYLKMPVTQAAILEAIQQSSGQKYLEAFQVELEASDPYSEDFVELDHIEVFILDGIDQCLKSAKNASSLAHAFGLLIDVLDYCQGFSADAADELFWNKQLEREIEFQRSVFAKENIHKMPDLSIYQLRYGKVAFSDIY